MWQTIETAIGLILVLIAVAAFIAMNIYRKVTAKKLRKFMEDNNYDD